MTLGRTGSAIVRTSSNGMRQPLRMGVATSPARNSRDSAGNQFGIFFPEKCCGIKRLLNRDSSRLRQFELISTNNTMSYPRVTVA